MRILHALHDYLPDQVAGVEVYTNRLALDQSRRHEVGVLHACVRPHRPTGEVRRTIDGPLTLFGVVQNRRWTRFEQTWSDDSLTAGFEEVLLAFAPNVLHVQHLMNLGTALPAVARRHGVPIVMTLHDHWFACAAGGQRFRGDRSRCDTLDADRCGACIATQRGPALAVRGARQRRRSRSASSRPELGVKPALGIASEAVAPRMGMSSVWVSSVSARARHGWRALTASSGRPRIEARWSALRAMSRNIDVFFAPSRDMRAAAIEFGLPAERILHVPHGMPVDVPQTASAPERARRFGYVGSLVPHKGVHDLVRAFDGLPEDATLDVFGALTDAPRYVDELRSLARHPGIRFHGEQRPEEVPARIAGLDVVVVPSIWRENAPLSILEAFALGRPVVASRIGGHPELLGPLDALLFEPGDVQHLASLLLRLAGEPGFVQAMAARIPAVPPLEDHTAALEAVYNRLRVAAPGEASASLPA